MPIEPAECRTARLFDATATGIDMLCQVCRQCISVLTQLTHAAQMPPPIRQPLMALNDGFDRTD